MFLIKVSSFVPVSDCSINKNYIGCMSYHSCVLLLVCSPIFGVNCGRECHNKMCVLDMRIMIDQRLLSWLVESSWRDRASDTYIGEDGASWRTGQDDESALV